MDFDNDHNITYFREKPLTKDWISSGFFVFSKKIFDYLDESDNCVLEKESFETLTKERQISIYQDNGFFMGMDTYKDMKILNEHWKSRKARWKIWNK